MLRRLPVQAKLLWLTFSLPCPHLQGASTQGTLDQPPWLRQADGQGQENAPNGPKKSRRIGGDCWGFPKKVTSKPCEPFSLITPRPTRSPPLGRVELCGSPPLATEWCRGRRRRLRAAQKKAEGYAPQVAFSSKALIADVCPPVLPPPNARPQRMLEYAPGLRQAKANDKREPDGPTT